MIRINMIEVSRTFQKFQIQEQVSINFAIGNLELGGQQPGTPQKKRRQLGQEVKG